MPELYDLEADPGEEKNLVYLEKKVFEDLSARAEALMDEAGRNAHEVDLGKVDEETREKLAALGYVGSFTDPSKLQGQKLANPRDKIGVFNELSRAREIGLAGDIDEAIRTIEAIIAEDPTISDAHFSLGNVLYKARRFDEAIAAFEQVARAQARRLLRRHQHRQLLPGHGPLRRRREVRRRLPGPGVQGFPALLPPGQHQGPPRPAREGHPLFREVPGGESALRLGPQRPGGGLPQPRRERRPWPGRRSTWARPWPSIPRS